MHAMGGKWCKTDAARARLVWRAAFPKKEPLDDDTAAVLGHDLSWTSTWCETDSAATSQKFKNDEMARLAEISTQARALSVLFDKDDRAVWRLERFYHAPLGARNFFRR
jgi:hypothetical protein